jgi:hypothetical protein
MEEERPGRRLIGYDPAMRLRLFRSACATPGGFPEERLLIPEDGEAVEV